MATNENTSDNMVFDINRKKKSKRIKCDVLSETTVLNNSTDDSAGNQIDDRENDYNYDYLVKRIYDRLPQEPEPTQLLVAPPQVGRLGTRRTLVQNFGFLCKALQRQEKQLFDYFLVELGTGGSIDGNHAMIIKGRFSQRQIEHVLRSFIQNYVVCKTCHSPRTALGKMDRLTLIKCNSCQSQYSVPSIRPGFQAQMRRH